jgi:hypothetical protein
MYLQDHRDNKQMGSTYTYLLVRHNIYFNLISLNIFPISNVILIPIINV